MKQLKKTTTSIMVENAISSMKGSEVVNDESNKRGYNLKDGKEVLYVLFEDNKVELFNNGEKLKEFDLSQNESMKDSMDKAGGVIKDIKQTLNNLELKEKQGISGKEGGFKKVKGGWTREV